MFRPENHQRFSIRKFSIGVASTLIALVTAGPALANQVTVSPEPVTTGQVMDISYQYVLETELTAQERQLLVKNLPQGTVGDRSTYYLIYRTSQTLPKTGNADWPTSAFVLGTGLLLVGLSLLKGRKKPIIVSLLLLTGTGTVTVSAITGSVLSAYNRTYQLRVGDSLPDGRLQIEGYEFLGYVLGESAQALPMAEQSRTETSSTTSQVSSSQSQISVGQPAVTEETTVATQTSRLTTEAETSISQPTTTITSTAGTETTSPESSSQSAETRVELVPIPFETNYEEDPTSPLGTEVLVQRGQVGQKQLTYTNGVLTEEVVVIPALPALVRRGSQVTTTTASESTETSDAISNPDTSVVPEPAPAPVQPPINPEPIPAISYEAIAFDLEIIPDDNLPLGQEVEVQAGVEGLRWVKYLDGQVVESRVETEPVKRIIRRGTKVAETTETTETETTNAQTTEPTITQPAPQPPAETQPTQPKIERQTQEIAPGTRYQDDPSLALGQEREISPGRPGLKEITLTDGQVTGERVLEEPVDRVLARGTLNPAPLAQLLATAEEKVAEDYSTESWSALSRQIEATRILLAKPGLTQPEVETGLEALQQAISALAVEKSRLQTAIIQAESRQSTDYSPESWSVFTRSLERARQVLNLTSVKQSQLDQALADLTQAEAGLTTDSQSLEDLVTQASQKIEADFSPSSWTVFSQALTTASQVLADTTASQSALNQAREALSQALAQLSVDKTALSQLVQEAAGKVEDDYSSSSWQSFKPVLTEARLTLALSSAKQSEVNQSAEALRTALRNLTVDRQPLLTALAATNQLLSASYTTASWQIFDKIRSQIRQLSQQETVKQSELDTAKANLATALTNLVRLKTKPVLTLSSVSPEVLTKSAQITHQLIDQNQALIKGVISLYDRTTGNLIKQVDMATDLTTSLTGLDYNRPYALETSLTYDLGNGAVTEVLPNRTNFELALKALALKEVDEARLYAVSSNLAASPILTLDHKPTDYSSYFVKVTSDRFKDIQLAVSDITEVEKDGKSYYKVQTALPDMISEADQAGYEAGYSFLVAKTDTSIQGIRTFTELLSAIQANPSGDYKLAADLSAEGVALSAGKTSYLDTAFKGSLTGINGDKKFAIHDLKAPLFASLEGARVSGLDLKTVDIDSNHNYVGALAQKISGSSQIRDVAIEGDIDATYLLGVHDATVADSVEKDLHVGSLAGHVESSTLDNISFVGTLTSTNTAVRLLNPERYISHSHNITGGLAGKVNGNSSIRNIYIDADIVVGNGQHLKAGGVIGQYWSDTADTEVTNVHARGSLINQGQEGQVGGLYGSVGNGKFYNSSSAMKVVGGKLLTGDGQNIWDFKLDVVTGVAQGEEDSWASWKSQDQVDAALAAMNLTATTTDSGQVDNAYEVDYTEVYGYQASHAQAYRNLEKLLPFYNKEYLVKLANSLAVDDKLNQVELLSVTEQGQMGSLTDLAGQANQVTKLLLNYADDSVETREVTYLGTLFGGKIAEYQLTGSQLRFTPDQFVNSYQALAASLLPDLQAIDFSSEAVWAALATDGDKTDKLGKLYLEEAFAAVKTNLPAYLNNVLATSTVYGDTKAVADYIRQNGAKLLLGLAYISRWYKIDFADTNIQHLALFQQDFFGKPVETLDWLIEVGGSGYNRLNPLYNDLNHQSHMEENGGVASLQDYLEAFRSRFAPNLTASSWFYNAAKAFVVEVDSHYNDAVIGTSKLYDKLNQIYTKGYFQFDYSNMILPLLTAAKDKIYVISTVEGLQFGSIDSYVDAALASSDPTTYATELDKFKALVRKEAQNQANHWSTWYRLANSSVRDNLINGLPIWDNLYDKDNQTWSKAYGTGAHRAVTDFFGPTGHYTNYETASEGIKTSEAYSDTANVFFVGIDALDQEGHRGGSIWTHEKVHVWDEDVYMAGHKRRDGHSLESYAEGLLQSPRSDGGRIAKKLALNLYFDLAGSSDLTEYNASPNRFRTSADLKTYTSRLLDVLYMLDYAEAQAILKLTDQEKAAVLTKLTPEEVVENTETHYNDKFVKLSAEDIAALNLRTVDDFITNNLAVSRHHYKDGTKGTRDYSLNAYVSVSMFSPFYGLVQNPKGTSGGYTFRRTAYELLAHKGYEEGFIPYISNQYKDQATAAGHASLSDDFIISKIFNGEFGNKLTTFKKEMFKQRIDQLTKLKPVGEIETTEYMHNTTSRYTLTNFNDIQNLMDEYVRLDAQEKLDSGAVDWNWSQRVDNLKEMILKAYLKSTREFEDSIFNP